MAMPTLVTAALLAEHLQDPGIRVVDVRWYLDGRSGALAHEAGHIPGAVHLDIDRDLASPRGPDRPGRHPLPTAEALAAALSRAGIGPTSKVIAYDDGGGATAARLWWLLGAFGHPAEVALLDGGIQAWQAAGQPLESGPVTVAPAPLVPLALRPGLVVDRERVRAASEQGDALLLDARAEPRYEGKVEPIDPKAGHIPGAKNAPFGGNLTGPGGAFLPADELRARYRQLGAGERPVIVYCGSGVTACHDLFALHLAGHEAQLYEGSWSDWSSDPAAPVATGPGA
jgi:thiosulfate/3-mercaptopyruvate sulfurtransferase